MDASASDSDVGGCSGLVVTKMSLLMCGVESSFAPGTLVNRSHPLLKVVLTYFPCLLKAQCIHQSSNPLLLPPRESQYLSQEVSHASIVKKPAHWPAW